jgi:alpha-amylase
MKNICLYFHVHQPIQIKTHWFFEIGTNNPYYNDNENQALIRKAADNSYLPSNKILLGLIKKYNGKFKVSFFISGFLLHIFEKYMPDVLESFRELAKTGCVEFLASTYSDSLASLISKEEFSKQVKLYNQKILTLLGVKPKVFLNTELIYSNKIGRMISELKYKTALIEGSDHALEWRSPNYIYQHPSKPQLNILMNNFRLSETIIDDNKGNKRIEGTTKVDNFIQQLQQTPAEEKVFNVILDYEKFGGKKDKHNRNIEFIKELPSKIFSESNIGFSTPSDLAEDVLPIGKIDIKHPVCWSGRGRDFSAWTWNELQSDTFKKLYALEESVKKCRDTDIQENWPWLQSSDHFFYMSSKWFENSDLSGYLNQYDSPYLAYINFMNMIVDFSKKVNTYILARCQPKRSVHKKLARQKLNSEDFDSILENEYLKGNSSKITQKERIPDLTFTNN